MFIKYPIFDFYLKFQINTTTKLELRVLYLYEVRTNSFNIFQYYRKTKCLNSNFISLIMRWEMAFFFFFFSFFIIHQGQFIQIREFPYGEPLEK